jgi:hypothetical protein
MMIVRLPITFYVRRDPNLNPLLVPRFSPFAIFSPWEP